MLQKLFQLLNTGKVTGFLCSILKNTLIFNLAKHTVYV